MLAHLEGDHVRELRHDFRAEYGTAYDAVPTDEAIDLILTLPSGSLWRGVVHGDTWTRDMHWQADVLDLLMVINWRMAGCPTDAKPKRIPRPGDSERQESAVKKARAVKHRLETTKWKDA